MILDTFLNIASLGAKQPLFLSSEEFLPLKKKAILSLENIIASLPENTETKQHVTELRDELKKDIVNDYILAKSFTKIADIFVEYTLEDKSGAVKNFQNNLQNFYKRAQNYYTFEQKRERITENTSLEELEQHDTKLSKTIGMMYVLEYLLTLDKAITNATSAGDKMYIIISRTVELPEGEFPGLWFDFQQDEILRKFILDLFNDTHRNTLIEAFYKTKRVLMNIEVRCDPNGQCSANYTDLQVEKIQESLKLFIKTIIDTYISMGIENLSSVFLSPYGEKTKLIKLPF